MARTQTMGCDNGAQAVTLPPHVAPLPRDALVYLGYDVALCGAVLAVPQHDPRDRGGLGGCGFHARSSEYPVLLAAPKGRWGSATCLVFTGPGGLETQSH